MSSKPEWLRTFRRNGSYKRRQGLNGGDVARIRDQLRAIHKGICQCCGVQTNTEDMRREGTPGATYPTIQHIVPLRDGGGWDWWNVTLYCHACNQRDNRHGQCVHETHM